MNRARLLSVLLAALAGVATAVPAATASAPAADPSCIRPVVHTAGPVGTGSCPGVRPGALVIIPSRNAGCTLGFVYRDQVASRWYITTAGHCIVGEGKQMRWAEGQGPVATDGNGKPFGRFVFGALKGRYDVALILISRGIAPKASMCHFGGPTGLSTSRANGPVVLEHYGNSAFGTAGIPARSGLALGLQDPYTVYSLLPSFQGDSGGPVVDASNGRAIGYVTSLTVSVGTNAPVGGPIYITRLGPQMALVQSALKRSLVLRTAAHSPSALGSL